MLSEDVEDESGAVHDLGTYDVLQRAALGGGELTIDDDRVGTHSANHLSELPGLAGPEVCCGVGVVALLNEGVQDLGARSFGECCELGE